MELLLSVEQNEARQVKTNLHSNMELLLLFNRGLTIWHVDKFTFQYGATTICNNSTSMFAIISFTFQYGATTILLCLIGLFV